MKKIIISFFLICYLIQVGLFGQTNPDSSEKSSNQITFSPDERPLIFVDDKKINSNAELNSVDPNNVWIVKIIKNEPDSINKYGPEAKDGIVFVYSKNYVAINWYTKFAKYSRKVKKLSKKSDFQYTDYKIYLNEELLKEDFFDGLDNKFKNIAIKKVKYKKLSKEDHRGEITLITSPT